MSRSDPSRCLDKLEYPGSGRKKIGMLAFHLKFSKYSFPSRKIFESEFVPCSKMMQNSSLIRENVHVLF